MHDMVYGVTAINSWGDAPGYFISPLWGFPLPSPPFVPLSRKAGEGDRVVNRFYLIKLEMIQSGKTSL